METTLFALTSDSEIATVKAALQIAYDYWTDLKVKAEGLDDPIFATIASNQAQDHKALYDRIEREVW